MTVFDKMRRSKYASLRGKHADIYYTVLNPSTILYRQCRVLLVTKRYLVVWRTNYLSADTLVLLKPNKGLRFIRFDAITEAREAVVVIT